MKRQLLVILIALTTASAMARKAVPAAETIPPAVRANYTYYLYEAIKDLEEGRDDEALMLVNHCISIAPREAEAHHQLARIYEKYGAVTNQNIELAIAKALEPDNWEYTEEIVSLLAKAQRYEGAQKLLEEELKRHPDNAKAWEQIAYLYYELDLYSKSAKAIERYEKLSHPTSGTVKLRSACYMLTNKPKTAISITKQHLDKHPNDYEMQVYHASLHDFANRSDEALRLYEEILRDNPDNSYVYPALYDYYCEHGDTARADDYIITALTHNQLNLSDKMSLLRIQSRKALRQKNAETNAKTRRMYETLVEQYPREEDIHMYYMYFLLQTRQPADSIKAAEEMRTIIDINPHNQEAWKELFISEAGHDNFEQALLTADSAASIFPQDHYWPYNEAILSQLTKKYQDAVDHARRAVRLINADETTEATQLNGGRIVMFQLLGDCLYELGQKDSSYAYYEAALKIYPDNISLMNNYAYHLALDSADLPRAEKMSAKAIEAKPNEATYLDTYAWILFVRGNNTLAMFYIERAVDNLTPQQTGTSEIWEHYQTIMLATGNTAKAEKAAAKLQEIRAADQQETTSDFTRPTEEK